MSGGKRLVALATVYLLLLAGSFLARIKPQPPAPWPETMAVATVAAPSGDEPVRVAYQEYAPQDASADLPAVVLLHGSPGSSNDFATLGPALGARFRVLTPDLPGFGSSTRRVADYSIRAHATYTAALLDQLQIERAHLLGFSMGGGVALELIRQQPHRASSLTLLSAIGVQELELLGNYHLNHAVHGAQLLGLRLLHYGLPHFGALDGFPLDIPYARNFYDTDQRPLRGVLATLEIPTLIVHGNRDVLVPPAAAREHHRLVPQSELQMLEDSHFFVFRNGRELLEPIGSFIARAEAGEATTRAQALPQRTAAARQPFNPRQVPPARGLSLLILMALLAVATFASEDLASIGTGLLVAHGRLGFIAGSIACFSGILFGDVMIYLAGRFLGRPWLGRAPIRWLLSNDDVDRARNWLNRKGLSVIFASRFLPGTRVATYFSCGLLAIGFRRFVFYLAAAVALWVPLLVGFSALAGTRLLAGFETFQRWALPGLVAALVAVWLLLQIGRLLLTRQGRRRLVGHWRRWTRWEFWPPWLFYPPLVAKVLSLGLRHRSPTLFTAANPAIPAGGFIGESKAQILDQIDPRWVAGYRLIRKADQTAQLESVAEFMAANGLDFPIVLKPDVGERGRAVTVVHEAGALEPAIDAAPGDLLAQEYVPGVELGVFYVRRPDEEHGRIFSVTEKQLPVVVGDGQSTTEELVLADPRAVVLAKTYLRRLGSACDRIPAAGEPVRLVEIGTHCRGAVFLDGKRWLTPELERAVEAISRSFPGFHFGRYDLKAPSYQAFQRGEGVRVLELNGVTSEATHIYDPKYSLLSAYRTLFRQWELAFEIGGLNRERGVEPATVRDLMRRIVKRR